MTIIVQWRPKAAKELEDLKKINHRWVDRIFELIESIENDPYTGKGKPEALKHNLSGCYSRRITQQHRLVYRMSDNASTVIIESCKGHYTK
jgi:toxin YoeB